MNQKYAQHEFIINGVPRTSVAMRWMDLSTRTSDTESVLKHFNSYGLDSTVININYSAGKSNYQYPKEVFMQHGKLIINTKEV